MSKVTKGSLEADISKSITQWEKDFLGRGSIAVKSDIVRDMIIVTLRGILTPAEYKVSETKEGMLAIKKNRAALVESGVAELNKIISDLTGEEVTCFHTDISTQTGERVMVFRLGKDLENSLN
ncbi:DUF2294 domain-containing protein [Rossellomorea sp. AcN35-11]|nr:DUF2294 domain-containing protein [Rossellomorea aquimaris]WJV29676.1 DUF2294 domain-containing protein [Rossellomorea sp. AcN35-11]